MYEDCIMSNKGDAYRGFDRKPGGERTDGIPRRELQDNITRNLQE